MPVQPSHLYPSRPPVSLHKLPPHPDLEQLKRQAKELHHAYEAGVADALAEVQRFFSVRQGEVLTLTQAQLALARSYGFESWPKLKAHVDGVTFHRLRDAVKAGDTAAVGNMLGRRPELVNYCADDDGERRLIHWAVLHNDPAMVRELMRHGADARVGIWPHRESTAAYTMAKERGLDQLVAAIEAGEAERRELMSCPNVTISPEQDKLNAAIREQRNAEAIAMLEAQGDLMKQCDREGGTPLHVACSAANAAMVDWLCDHRADARKLDIAGQSPMDRAVHSLNMRQQDRRDPALRILQRLQARGCEMTPLGAAALGDVDAIRRLYRESPGTLTGGFNWLSGGLLTAAARFGQIASVRCLLDLGLNPDEPILLGGSEDEAWSWGGPLWHSAAFGEHAIATLLLDRGADPSANVYASGWPLDRAYERGDRAMVDLLYTRGAKASVYTVCHAHDVEAAKRILEQEGDDPDVIREMVWSAACDLSLPIVQLALPRLNLAPDDPKWHDLLRQPMRRSQPPAALRPPDYRHDWRFMIMKMMLDKGPNPNIRASYGLTLLHFAATSGSAWGGEPIDDRARFAELLLDVGADPALRDELLCSTAMGWAARYGRTELVKLLIDRGIAANEPEAQPWATPLAWAMKMGHEPIAVMLRQHGATR
ncbi:MAG: ankyrin repeat domain-containing protein [Phycisphaeraceae bacterium]